jgi:Zn-dependent M28 family amino/carboxypeptidase
MLHLDLSIIYDFFDGSGYNVKKVQSRIDSLKKPFSFNLKTLAEINVSAKYYPQKNTENVIGMLEGADPVLKNEFVLVSAHLDHVGQQAGLFYFPGANDNASGSACVLQIARAFANEKMKPLRSVIFILFACEEHGSDGSEYLADHLPFDIKNITAQINLDCVGYGDSIQVGNGKSCPVLWKIAKAQDSLYTKRLVSRTWHSGGADMRALFDKGVPGVYFVTTNSYVHLHLTTDTPQTLNLPLFEKVCKLAYLTAFRVANNYYKRENIITIQN